MLSSIQNSLNNVCEECGMVCTLKEDPKVFKSRANHYFEMDTACCAYCATQPEASEVHRDVYIVDLELIN